MYTLTAFEPVHGSDVRGMAETRRKPQTRRRPSPAVDRPAAASRIVRLPLRAPRPGDRFDRRLDHCVKCSSTFIEREPAFLHCRYCGSLTRILGASLVDQELYELRSGLRLAS